MTRLLALSAERAWLDRLLQRELAAQRQSHELSADEFRGLWVSEDMAVAALLRESAVASDEEQSCPASETVLTVVRRFGLSELECCLLVLAAVADVDVRYESIFAYLNALASRRWPTFDLAVRLFGRRGDVLSALSPDSRLMASGLIQPLPAESPRPAIATEFRAAPAFISILNGIAPALPPEARWIDPSTDDSGPLAAVADIVGRTGDSVTLVLEGEKGSGRVSAAAAFARRLKRRLLMVELHCGRPEHHRALRDALLLARLLEALPLISIGDEPGKEPAKTDAALTQLMSTVGQTVLVLAGAGAMAGQAVPAGRAVHVPFPAPTPSQRARSWRHSLVAQDLAADDEVVEQLAARFRLDVEDIHHAAAAARLAAQAEGIGPAQRRHLFAAARRLSSQSLAQLAQSVPPSGMLTDLVLPQVAQSRVRAFYDAVCHYDVVHREWGLARDGRAAGGIAALFQGPSGTGKTMTAGVIAGEAGLDLYRIDLSGVVSKYIGETEKNLDAIFRAARRSSAILMFDEADALFGKRAEVRDAHDRYANIEVAYLLQRIEDHDGPVILATNLAKNIDQAFARRLAYIIEFPRPDAEARTLLWQRMLRPPVPVDGDVDCTALGRAFELTGGEIRKAALEAAYMAAADGKRVRMRHLVASATREARRQGRMGDAATWAGAAEVA